MTGADQLYIFDAMGYDGAGFVAAAKIRLLFDGTVASGIVPDAMTVSVIQSGGATVEALRVTSGRKVNLGVSAPTSNLHLSGPFACP